MTFAGDADGCCINGLYAVLPSAAAGLPTAANTVLAPTLQAIRTGTRSTRGEVQAQASTAGEAAEASSHREQVATLSRRVSGLRKKLSDKAELVASLEQQLEAKGAKCGSFGSCFFCKFMVAFLLFITTCSAFYGDVRPHWHGRDADIGVCVVNFGVECILGQDIEI